MPKVNCVLPPLGVRSNGERMGDTRAMTRAHLDDVIYAPHDRHQIKHHQTTRVIILGELQLRESQSLSSFL